MATGKNCDKTIRIMSRTMCSAGLQDEYHEPGPSLAEVDHPANGRPSLVEKGRCQDFDTFIEPLENVAFARILF